MGHAVALIGAQYGSEGKGMVASKIADQFDVFVRTGGPNAGHTYYHQGEKIVSRSVPVGAINPTAALVIGAGAVLDIGVLVDEMQALTTRGLEVKGRVFVDGQAAVITAKHRLAEGGTKGEAHQHIGSTGEGVGAARMAKIGRGVLGEFAHEQAEKYTKRLANFGVVVTDTVAMLEQELQGSARVLLEGTQGSALSLTHGSWPFVTSHDTGAAQLCADAGIAPSWLADVIMTVRTYPIRVAGNSGPLPRETDWKSIGQQPETTTVTKKMRRVARYDEDVVRRAVILNRPSWAALTFYDYVWPECACVRSWEFMSEAAQQDVDSWADQIGCEVRMIGTGPDHCVWVP